MSVQRKKRGQLEKDNEALGLMANGSAGSWEVSVDGTTKGPERWFVQLEGSSVYFSFEVPSPEIIATALNFLGGRSTPKEPHAQLSAENGSLVLGKHRQTPVILIRDDEYKDRYFLVVGQDADVVVRFTIAEQDLKDVREALRQATGDLEDEGRDSRVEVEQLGGSKVAKENRIAILLHGHSCAGKTSIGRLLWGKEPIVLDGGPPYDRLRRDEDVIVLELGRGEDYPLRPDSRRGPTRNPEAWLGVLDEENRPLFAFLLTAEWPTVEARARAEVGRGVTVESARLSYCLYHTREEGMTFPATAGIFEHLIDTTRMEHREEVAAEIRNVVNKARPYQRWP